MKQFCVIRVEIEENPTESVTTAMKTGRSGAHARRMWMSWYTIPLQGILSYQQRTKVYFATTVALWDADFYVKVDDDIHVNIGKVNKPNFLVFGICKICEEIEKEVAVGLLEKAFCTSRGMNLLLRENRMENLVDERCSEADNEMLEEFLDIAARCTDLNPDERLTMNQILQLLEQEVMSPCPSDFYEPQSDYC